MIKVQVGISEMLAHLQLLFFWIMHEDNNETLLWKGHFFSRNAYCSSFVHSMHYFVCIFKNTLHNLNHANSWEILWDQHANFPSTFP